jgi:hypothetical protein
MGQEQSKPAGRKAFKPSMVKRKKKKRKEAKSSLLKDQQKEEIYKLSSLGGSMEQGETQFGKANNTDFHLSQHPPQDDISFLSGSQKIRNQNEGSNEERHDKDANYTNKVDSREVTEQNVTGIQHSTASGKKSSKGASEQVFSMPDASEFALVPYVPPDGDAERSNNFSDIMNDFTGDSQIEDNKHNYFDDASLNSNDSSSRDSVLEEMQAFAKVQENRRPGSTHSEESRRGNRASAKSKSLPKSAFNLDISSAEEEGDSISSSSGGGYSYSSKERKQIDDLAGFMGSNPPPPDSVTSVDVDTTSESSRSTPPKSDSSASMSPSNLSSSKDEDLFVLSELKTLSNSIKATYLFKEQKKEISPSRTVSPVDLGLKSQFPTIDVNKMMSSFNEELIETHRDRAINEKRRPHEENRFNLPKFDPTKAMPIYHDDEIHLNTKSQTRGYHDEYSSESGSEDLRQERGGKVFSSSFKVDSGSDSESPGGFMFSIDRLDLAKEEIDVGSTRNIEESGYQEKEDGFVTAINKVIRAQRDIVSNEDKPGSIPESHIPDTAFKSKSYTDPTKKAVALVTDKRGRERDIRRHQPRSEPRNRTPVATSRAERRRLRSRSPRVEVRSEEHEVQAVTKPRQSPILPTRRERRARRYRSASPSVHGRPSSTTEQSRITIDESYSSEDQHREANRNEEINEVEFAPQRRQRKDITELRSRARASRKVSTTLPSTKVSLNENHHEDDKNPYLTARRQAYIRDSSPNNRTNSSTFRRNNELIARLKMEKASKRKMILPETKEEIDRPVTESADEMIARLKMISGNNERISGQRKLHTGAS